MQRRRLFTAAGLGLAAASRPASAMIWNTKRVTPLEERVKPLVVRYLMSPGWSEEAPLMKLLIEGSSGRESSTAFPMNAGRCARAI